MCEEYTDGDGHVMIVLSIMTDKKVSVCDQIICWKHVTWCVIAPVVTQFFQLYYPQLFAFIEQLSK